MNSFKGTPQAAYVSVNTSSFKKYTPSSYLNGNIYSPVIIFQETLTFAVVFFRYVGIRLGNKLS